MNMTVEAFLAFVKTKPQDEEYAAFAPGYCALALFVQSQAADPYCGATFYSETPNSPHVEYPDDIYEAAIGAAVDGDHDPYTWGVLAARLEALK